MFNNIQIYTYEVSFVPKRSWLLCICPCLPSFCTCKDKWINANVYVLCLCHLVLSLMEDYFQKLCHICLRQNPICLFLNILWQNAKIKPKVCRFKIIEQKEKNTSKSFRKLIIKKKIDLFTWTSVQMCWRKFTERSNKA